MTRPSRRPGRAARCRPRFIALAVAALSSLSCGRAEPASEAAAAADSTERGSGRSVETAAVGGVEDAATPRAPARTGPTLESTGPSAEEVVRAPLTDGDIVLVDVAEVREKLERGDPVLVIDARGSGDYAQEHIPGSINVPLQKIAAAGELPGVARDYEIVVYCIAESCPISRNAVRALTAFGYSNVKDMRAGLVGWKQAGFPTEKGRG